jgi:hypothetical protein
LWRLKGSWPSVAAPTGGFCLPRVWWLGGGWRSAMGRGSGRRVASGVIQADFDRIAVLPDVGWGHSRQYYGFLLK